MAFRSIMIQYAEIQMVLVILSINFMIKTADIDEVCVKTLAGYNGSDDLNILAIGMIRTNMLLVTRDYNVYLINRESMDMAINTLYLRKKSVPMSDQYPKLYNSKQMKNIKQYTYNTVTLIDSYSDWLCLITWKLVYPSFGLCYDLSHSRIIVGWRLTNRFNEITISTTRPGYFYTIKNQSESDPSLQIAAYSTSDSTIQDKTHLIITEFRSLCYDNADPNQIRIIEQSLFKTCSKPVKWSVMKGFVANGRFYLFARDSIYSFNEDVYNSKEESYPFKSHSYQSFFNCIGSSEIKTTTVTAFPITTKTSPSAVTKTTKFTNPSSLTTGTNLHTKSTTETDHTTTSSSLEPTEPSTGIKSIIYIILSTVITAIFLSICYCCCCKQDSRLILIKSIYSSKYGKRRSGISRIQNSQANSSHKRSNDAGRSRISSRKTTLKLKSKRSASNRYTSISTSGISRKGSSK